MSKFIQSPAPFEGFVVYGPYDDDNGRVCVKLHRMGRSSTMTVARYIMSVGLGRRIELADDVDHIDGNGRNDDWRNLQVVPAYDNRRKRSGTISLRVVEFICATCAKHASRRYNACVPYERHVLFCSRACMADFNSASKNYQDTALVEDALQRNKYNVSTTQRTVAIQGTRLKRLSVGMKAVLTFLSRKDKARAPTDFGTCCCGARLKQSRHKYCSPKCAQDSRVVCRLAPKPDAGTLEKQMREGISYCALGRMYGVSDNAVRKWARGYGLI